MLVQSIRVRGRESVRKKKRRHPGGAKITGLIKKYATRRLGEGKGGAN